MNNGWVPINRYELFNLPFYTIPLTCRLAEHLLYKANHAENQVFLQTGECLTLKRGQTLTSSRTLAKETGLTRQNVRTSLDHLEKAHFLTHTSTNHYSLITIVDYDTYASFESSTNPQANPHLTHTQPTPNPQANHKQEYKNEKNDKNTGGNGNGHCDGFTEFWSNYPRKESKPFALRAWKAQKAESCLPAILADIAARRPDWESKGRQYTPLPASYLNARRWEDETTQPMLQITPSCSTCHDAPYFDSMAAKRPCPKCGVHR